MCVCVWGGVGGGVQEYILEEVIPNLDFNLTLTLENP